MHSDINQEILAQFETAFNRIETSGVPGYESIKSKVVEFLGYCSSGAMPLVLLQQKVVAIKKELQIIDAMSNHGYLYLAYETAKKNLEGATKKRVEGDNIDPERVSLISTLQGKAKIQEAIKEPEMATGTIFDLVESYDLSYIPIDLKDDQTSTISRKSRSIIKSLAENVDKVDFERAVVRMAKRIRTVLNEVRLAPHIATKKEDVFGYDEMFFEKPIHHIQKHGIHSRIDPSTKIHDLGKIGDIHLKSMDGTNGETYLMSHDDTGNIHHVLKVKNPEGFHKDTLTTNLAVANPNIQSPIKMHDIYHHLVKNGVTLMSDSEQSEGGLGVWKKLSRKPDVNVYAWNTQTDKPINTDRFLRDTSDTHATYADDHKNAYDVMRNTRLIATKKDLTEETLNEVFLFHEPKSYKFQDSMYYDGNKFNDIKDYLTTTHRETDLGKIGNKLHVTQFQERGAGKIVTHDDEGNIHHVMTYERPYTSSPNTLKIKLITANDKYKVAGAHELYNHLMDRGHIIESDTDQTPGGLHIWKKLSRMPGVNVHGWDTHKNVPVNTDRYLRDTSDTHTSDSDLKDSPDMETYQKKANNKHAVVLVAHK